MTYSHFLLSKSSFSLSFQLRKKNVIFSSRKKAKSCLICVQGGERRNLGNAQKKWCFFLWGLSYISLLKVCRARFQTRFLFQNQIQVHLGHIVGIKSWAFEHVYPEKGFSIKIFTHSTSRHDGGSDVVVVVVMVVMMRVSKMAKVAMSPVGVDIACRGQISKSAKRCRKRRSDPLPPPRQPSPLEINIIITTTTMNNITNNPTSPSLSTSSSPYHPYHHCHHHHLHQPPSSPLCQYIPWPCHPPSGINRETRIYLFSSAVHIVLCCLYSTIAQYIVHCTEDHEKIILIPDFSLFVPSLGGEKSLCIHVWSIS